MSDIKMIAQDLHAMMNDHLRRAVETWSRALDEASRRLIAFGCSDIVRVVKQGDAFCEELWIDSPPNSTRIGDALHGRPVYRQCMIAGPQMQMSIEITWLDPVLAP